MAKTGPELFNFCLEIPKIFSSISHESYWWIA